MTSNGKCAELLGLCSRPRWGSLQSSPISPAWLGRKGYPTPAPTRYKSLIICRVFISRSCMYCPYCYDVQLRGSCDGVKLTNTLTSITSTCVILSYSIELFECQMQIYMHSHMAITICCVDYYNRLP